jgi:hypothetical protein
MSPLFGHKDEEPPPPDEQVAAVERETERVRALPVTDLACEVMDKGFGPDGPGGPGKPGTIENPELVGTFDRVTVEAIGLAFTQAVRGRHVGPVLAVKLSHLLAEGLQLLELAALIRVQFHSSGVGTLDYVATRRGRTAVERSDVARLVAAADQARA